MTSDIRSYKGSCRHCDRDISVWLPTQSESTRHQGQWVRCADCDGVTYILGENKQTESSSSKPEWLITDPEIIEEFVVSTFPTYRPESSQS